jgi:glucose-6-phosphate isomerase
MGKMDAKLKIDPDITGGNQTVARQMSADPAPIENDDFKDDNALSLDLTYLFDAPTDPFPVTQSQFEQIGQEAVKAHRALLKGRGDVADKGVPMLGWQNLPESISTEHLVKIKESAKRFSEKIDAFVSLGIGGSYLGVEASIKALTHTWFNQLPRNKRGGAPEVYFLGQNMDPDYFRDTLDLLEGKRVGVNVISKSGTTTETAIAFRILRHLLEQSAGDDAKDLIVATTDPVKGALRSLVKNAGYESFVVPDDIGGRFSVLTDVGLFGIAVAGIDIEAFVAGFADMRVRTQTETFEDNIALLHAAARTAAYRNGKKIEVVATNSTALYQVGRFMEQLFPESEGHKGKGLWVSPSLYSEKLHANGQMVQQGERNILETFLLLENHDNEVGIPVDATDLDGLNYLPHNGRNMNFINRQVIDGPAFAHFQGGVPNMTLQVPRRSPYCLGQLYYLLERSVAVSGTLLGHNPFIQPGVEHYKRAMFALAGKPGFQGEKAKIVRAIEKLKKSTSL